MVIVQLFIVVLAATFVTISGKAIWKPKKLEHNSISNQLQLKAPLISTEELEIANGETKEDVVKTIHFDMHFNINIDIPIHIPQIATDKEIHFQPESKLEYINKSNEITHRRKHKDTRRRRRQRRSGQLCLQKWCI